ncbi:MAG: hypothetical protein EZS26_000857 [Candidatus Ordinivivax streblomastigis]|uniref:Uncharacterized protein n=1 Tax=Candidatus Ordinivivax streblomastigis TaxID=2540710 RepID=A0A5M8P3P3_9BACT|nr:MAG: hypothetical protein EZS26_000857 [Candidatus Ordinivivax streblomastigis]
MKENKKITLNRKWFTVILSILIFFIHNPLYILEPLAGLDHSWALGLEWAKLKGLSFGRDIAFTYGPLHFLAYGMVSIGDHSLLLWESLIYCITHIVIIFMYVYQFAGLLYKKRWGDYSLTDRILLILGLFLIIAFLSFAFIESILVFSCFLFVRLVFHIDLSKSNKKQYLLNILLNAILLSLAGMTKFNYTIEALTLIGIAVFGLIYQRKILFIVYILSTFIIFTIGFWLLSGQSLSTLPDYYIYGSEIVSGYTEAMKFQNTYGGFRHELFSLFVLLFVGSLSFLFFFVKKDFYHAFILFILLPLLFMAFKGGFVRADDGHRCYFFLQLVPCLIFLIEFLVESVPFSYKKIWKIFVICVIPVTSIILSREEFTRGFSNTVEYPLQSLLSADINTKRVDRYKDSLRTSYDPLPATFLQQAKGKTVDIIPWDIALLYAYDLNWSPRPVFQSYSAYTSFLDSINAQHFKGDKAPDNVIYLYNSIDDRYPLFDEPMVFRSLLENYEVQSPDNYLILQRRQRQKNYQYTFISEGVCPIGATINIPQLEGQHIYCNINIQKKLYGKLLTVLYKLPEPVRIYFYVKDRPKPIIHRFIPNLGTDGLFVSKYVFNLSDIYHIFEPNYEQDIEKIEIHIDNMFFYEQKMRYEFYSAPFSNIVRDK